MTTFRLLNTPIGDINKLDVNFEKCMTFILKNVGLREVPKEYFLQFSRLESIELQENELTELNFKVGPSVTFIDLSCNKLYRGAIKEVPPDTVELIDMTGNPYHSYMELQHIGEVVYGNGRQVNHQAIQRVEERRRRPVVMAEAVVEGQIVEAQVVEGQVVEPISEDSKNYITGVHNPNIQNNIRANIVYLLSQVRCPNYFEELCVAFHTKERANAPKQGFITRMFVSKMKEHEKEFRKLLEFYNSFENEIVYDYTNDLATTLPRIIEGVWSIAKESKHRDDILESLYAQMIDGRDYCFVAKYTRVINSLSSFDNNIKVTGLTVAEMVSMQLQFALEMYTTRPVFRERMSMFLDEVGISVNDKIFWMEAVEGFIEEHHVPEEEPIEQEYEVVDGIVID
jgi:ferredoxin-fold anticodon binding domain-containing protein